LGKYFGTDGIRGIAGEDLTAELAMAAAAAAARTLKASGRHVIVGEDTRASSDMLTSAIAAGLTAQGTDAWMAGVIPTPAVATLVAKNGAAAGIVVSASHNPYEYNGIKLFGPDGYKLPDAVEDEIETELDAILAGRSKVSSGRATSARWWTTPKARRSTRISSYRRARRASRGSRSSSTALTAPRSPWHLTPSGGSGQKCSC